VHTIIWALDLYIYAPRIARAISASKIQSRQWQTEKLISKMGRGVCLLCFGFGLYVGLYTLVCTVPVCTLYLYIIISSPQPTLTVTVLVCEAAMSRISTLTLFQKY
jgi:hypothetical protein